MTNSSFLKKLLFALSVVLLVSCDKDFDELGSDIVDDDIHSDMTPYYVDVVAYDKATGAVQSNNMTLNQLGILDNPVFGKTVSHFVTQIEMKSENPTLYLPQIDSVYMYVPYYSTATDVNSDGDTTYKLDSVYGNKAATFKLQMYRNGYYLRDTDPGASDNIQRYYSDDKAMVDNLKVGTPMFEKSDFSFSPSEIKINALQEDGTTKLVERKAPGMIAYLDTIAIKQIFLSDANRSNLINNNIFKNYFRGLYFKVEQTGDAVMTVPRFAEGTITIKFHDYESRTDGVAGPNLEKDRISKTITFNLKGNTINFFENTYNSTFNSAVTTSDNLNGDSRLYVKGGAGSMAVINLDDTQLNALTPAVMGEKVLINEANLVFYVDQNAATGMGKAGAVAPLRLYLYDLKNNRPIIDYSMDGTSSVSRPKRNKTTFGGIVDTIDEGPNAGKIRYRVRLTNHINNIIKGDSLNVKLGLVVTENINVASSSRLKTSFTEGDTDVKMVPLGSVQHPFGTVLYGSNIPLGSEDEKNRVKLEIYYTKPK